MAASYYAFDFTAVGIVLVVVLEGRRGRGLLGLVLDGVGGEGEFEAAMMAEVVVARRGRGGGERRVGFRRKRLWGLILIASILRWILEINEFGGFKSELKETK